MREKSDTFTLALPCEIKYHSLVVDSLCEHACMCACSCNIHGYTSLLTATYLSLSGCNVYFSLSDLIVNTQRR